jgi:hypothetical protein
MSSLPPVPWLVWQRAIPFPLFQTWRWIVIKIFFNLWNNWKKKTQSDSSGYTSNIYSLVGFSLSFCWNVVFVFNLRLYFYSSLFSGVFVGKHLLPDTSAVPSFTAFCLAAPAPSGFCSQQRTSGKLMWLYWWGNRVDESTLLLRQCR